MWLRLIAYSYGYGEYNIAVRLEATDGPLRGYAFRGRGAAGTATSPKAVDLR
jgi:hypothetical protein